VWRGGGEVGKKLFFQDPKWFGLQKANNEEKEWDKTQDVLKNGCKAANKKKEKD